MIGSSLNIKNEDIIIQSCDLSVIASIPNPRDFDVTIFNLLNCDPSKIAWDEFTTKFNPNGTRDILFHGGMIIVIGDPRIQIPAHKKAGSRVDSSTFLAWTGIDFTWDNQEGNTITITDSGKINKYAGYLKLINSWDYSFASCKLQSKFTEPNASTGELEKLSLNTLAHNRYSHPLAFELSLIRGVYRSGYPSNYFERIAEGKMIFLPPVKVNSEETVRIVLRDLLDIDTFSMDPRWIADIISPYQKAIDLEIEKVDTQLAKLNLKLEQLNFERVEKRKVLKLLYEREFSLEPIVLKILGILGAQIEEPVDKNKEDGWITVQLGDVIFEGVLEIKSTKKDHFTEDGRKQVVDWVQKGISERHKKYKGIFIGNSAVDKPIDQRPDPFPNSWKIAAKLSDISAFTTVQLYLAYKLDCEGRLDRDLFWKAIFECDGVCSFEGILDEEK